MDIHHNRIPLTRPQYQIWLASESCPDKALYTESILLTFDNAPAPAQLDRALNRLVQTTETLRLRVTRGKDGPLQYDAGYTPFACRVIPLSGEEELTAVFNEQSRYSMVGLVSIQIFSGVCVRQRAGLNRHAEEGGESENEERDIGNQKQAEHFG